MTIESTTETLYLSMRRIWSVEYGGLGGDIGQVIMTREAFDDLGQPEEIEVTVKRGENEGDGE